MVKGVLDVNSVFGIKNTEINSGFKKTTKVVRLVTSEARWHWPLLWAMASGQILSLIAVVHNIGY